MTCPFTVSKMRTRGGSAREENIKNERPSLEQSRVTSVRQRRLSTAKAAAKRTRREASAGQSTATTEESSKDNVSQGSTKCSVAHPGRSSHQIRGTSKKEKPRAETPSFGSGKQGYVDESETERWTTVSESESVPLTADDAHRLRVTVSPSGVTVDRLDYSSPEADQHSPRTVRFQKTGRKGTQEHGKQSPTGCARKKRSRFCFGYGLCVLCVLLALLPAALTTAYFLRAWTTDDDRWQSFCHGYDSDACVAAMDELHTLLTPSVEPCDNMYAYACDQWDRSPDSLVYNRTFVDNAVFKLYETINRTLLGGPKLRPNVFGRHVLQPLYASCYVALRAAQTTPLDVPSELSVLLVKRDMRAGMEVALNTSLQWGLEMLWGARLEHNGTASSYVHLYAGSSIADKFEGRDRGLTADAVTYLKQVVESLHIKRLTTIVDDAVRIDEVVQRQLCCREALDSRWVSLDDLDVFSWYLNEKQWWNGFARYLWKTEPDAAGLQKHLVVTGFRQIKNAFTILEQHADEVTLFYLYLLASSEVLQYDYRKHTFKKGTLDSGVVFSCIEATRRVLSPSWAYVFADASGYAHDTVAVGDMYEQFLSLSNESPYSTSMDNATRLRARGQMNALTIDAFPAFLPIKGVDIIRFSNDFRLGGSFGSDYLRLLGMSQSLARESEQRATLEHLNDDQLKGILEFSVLTRSLAVPTAYTFAPVFYEQDVPESFNYGTLGSLIAKELSEVRNYADKKKVVAPGSTSITGEATEEPSRQWWTEASRRSFNKTMQCWQRLANKTDASANAGESSNSSAATLEWSLLGRSLFVWSRGARMAFDAMRRVVERRTLRWKRDSHVIDEQWRTQQRVFFARFCLLVCSAALKEKGARRGVLSQRLRCMLPLANMREFHAAYNCSMQNESTYCPDL